jgi:hypothetical protein
MTGRRPRDTFLDGVFERAVAELVNAAPASERELDQLVGRIRAEAARRLASSWRRSRDAQALAARLVEEAAPETKHTCNDGRGPAFGRRTRGCPRCDELAAGARPRPGWNQTLTVERGQWVYQDRDVVRARELARHDCKAAGCRLVCTFGQW